MAMINHGSVLSNGNAAIKRGFDLLVSFIAITCLWWVIVLSWIIARLDTGASGFFIQLRVGRNGALFKVIKLRTMRPDDCIRTTVTTLFDSRITPIGRQLRRFKLDELPQLINVLKGDMSFVGPRPDVPGFADLLLGEDRIILKVRPGITGPATLKYRDEEELLAKQLDPEAYNRDVVWPDKVKINKDYINNWSLFKDICFIIKTVFGRLSC